jgi:hypothetical protein
MQLFHLSSTEPNFILNFFGTIYYIEFHHKCKKSIYHHYPPQINIVVRNGGNSVIIMLTVFKTVINSFIEASRVSLETYCQYASM